MIRNKNILDLSEYEAEIELKILAKELKDADKDYHELDDPKTVSYTHLTLTTSTHVLL